MENLQGTNFTLKHFKKINNDFKGIYENEPVIAIIDTDSNYYQLNPIFNRIKDPAMLHFIVKRFTKKQIEKYTKSTKGNMNDLLKLLFVLNHDEFIISPIIDKRLRDFEAHYNTTRLLGFDFEGESEIKTQVVWNKKRYIYESFGGYFTIKGLEIIKTNSSYFIRERIKKLLLDTVANYDINNTRESNIKFEQDYEVILKEFFNTEDIFFISNPVKIGAEQWDKWIVDYAPIMGANGAVKALLNFNIVLRAYKDRFSDLPEVHSGKIHIFELNEFNEFGFSRIGIPFEIPEHRAKEIMSMFNIHRDRQYNAKVDNIIDSSFEVFKFRKNLLINERYTSKYFSDTPF